MHAPPKPMEKLVHMKIQLLEVPLINKLIGRPVGSWNVVLYSTVQCIIERIQIQNSHNHLKRAKIHPCHPTLQSSLDSSRAFFVSECAQ